MTLESIGKSKMQQNPGKKTYPGFCFYEKNEKDEKDEKDEITTIKKYKIT